MMKRQMFALRYSFVQYQKRLLVPQLVYSAPKLSTRGLNHELGSLIFEESEDVPISRV